jgi:hypothetical protein
MCATQPTLCIRGVQFRTPLWFREYSAPALLHDWVYIRKSNPALILIKSLPFFPLEIATTS